MLRLPRDIPQGFKIALESTAETFGVENALNNLGSSVLENFGAKDVLVIFRHDGTTTKPEYTWASSKRVALPPNFSKAAPNAWMSSGIDEYATRDLSRRMSAVSYSVFSWPYPHFDGGQCTHSAFFKFPRDYTLLVPFSSEMLVTLDSEPRFFGYFAVMFDGFPEFVDGLVQLVISLPMISASVVAAALRQERDYKDVMEKFVNQIREKTSEVADILDCIKTGLSSEKVSELEKIESVLKQLDFGSNSQLVEPCAATPMISVPSRVRLQAEEM